MKTRTFFPVLYKTLLGAMVVSGALLATDGEEQSEPERVPVGERSVAYAEQVQAIEKRAEIAERLVKGEDFAEEERPELSDAEEQELAGTLERPEGQKDASSLKSCYYYSSHQGAFHYAMEFSLLGESVVLEDGSVWAVFSGDRYKTFDWSTGHTIVITPNHSLFSSYRYRLINLDTGASVKVNLFLGPIVNGPYTRWIVAIDYYNREVWLDDGSVWKISSVDNSTMQQWLPNHCVIMGINDGWLSGSNPNMLINVHINNEAIGVCLY